MMTASQSQLPELVHTVAELRNRLDAARAAGRRIGLVPTMGALHEGHLSLVRAAQAECDFVAISIFVNPTQFGPNEDFGRYPRTLAADCRLLADCRADLVFAPANEDVYPSGHETFVDVGSVAEPWEGRCRPGHFRGVATVVLKLFNLFAADAAFFGQKDYQQSLVIRRLAADLDVCTAVRVCPTVREHDGLAMSSRNRYLSSEARGRALSLWRSLCAADELFRRGEREAAVIEARMREILESAGGAIDYAALADPQTLAPLSRIADSAVALLAVRIDSTRLIDNHLLVPGGSPLAP